MASNLFLLSITVIIISLFTISFIDGKRSSSSSTGSRSSGSKVSGSKPSKNTGWGSSSSSSGTGHKSSGGSSGASVFSNSRSSSSRSSFSTSRNKQITAGVLGGIAGSYVGYKVGKFSGRSVPYYRTYHGRNYYYGYSNYQQTEHEQRAICHFEVDDNTSEWNVTDEDSGKRVSELVFECSSSQSCCELECCSDWQWWHTMLVMLAVVIMFSCCVLCAMKCRKKNEDNDYSTPPEKQPSAPPSSIYTDMNKMSYSLQHQAYPVQESYYTPQNPLPPAYGGYPTNAYTPYSQATFGQNAYQPIPTNPGPYA